LKRIAARKNRISRRKLSQLDDVSTRKNQLGVKKKRKLCRRTASERTSGCQRPLGPHKARKTVLERGGGTKIQQGKNEIHKNRLVRLRCRLSRRKGRKRLLLKRLQREGTTWPREGDTVGEPGKKGEPSPGGVLSAEGISGPNGRQGGDAFHATKMSPTGRRGTGGKCQAREDIPDQHKGN